MLSSSHGIEGTGNVNLADTIKARRSRLVAHAPSATRQEYNITTTVFLQKCITSI